MIFLLLSELQKKDIITIENGNNIGRVVDVEIDNNGNILNIIAEKRKFLISIFKNSEVSFKYSDIVKIGIDVILIKKWIFDNIYVWRKKVYLYV